ncbi:MAG: phytoene desaturase [Candidatus Peribacteraceae bacterium]|nr:phytoene desaturase [Candidatus Peribacteraceae bacterium]
MTKPHTVIIGSGIGGLAMACLLGQRGERVTVLEKNEQPGGRASVMRKDGFTFDMVPSWYLMPEVFEHFFALLGERISDHLDLQRLDPSYRVFFPGRSGPVDIHSDLTKDLETFEQLEPGCSPHLLKYLAEAKKKYEFAAGNVLYRNIDSLFDFMRPEYAKSARGLTVLSSMDRYTKSLFKSEELRQILQYSLVFLGNSPKNCPSLYSIMTHIDIAQGVFYPQGGIGSVITAMVKLAEARGVTIRCNAEVSRIETNGNRATGVTLASGETIAADQVVSNADRHWTDTRLLPPDRGNTSERYWEKAVLAPSAHILYLGVRGRCDGLAHHNFIFAKDWDRHFETIFDHPAWPDEPCVYVSAPSRTDPSVAPSDSENLFVLVPLAPGFERPLAEQEAFEERLLALMEKHLPLPDLKNRLLVRERFTVKDFADRYHSIRGTALGLAHTLRQTPPFRPGNQHTHWKNLFYVGAATAPGIGLPVCLISAELALKRMIGENSGRPLASVPPC